ncbi:hypothetical protein QOT17_008589 [Balamuthia mandrillaris]
MEEERTFTCRHESCCNLTASADRVQYQTSGSRTKHEKKKKGHSCNPQTCSICAKLEGKRTGNATVGNWACEHTNGCKNSYSSQSACVYHELHTYHQNCTDDCQRCVNIATNAKAKKDKERLEAVSKEEAQNRLKKREGDIKELNAHLQTIPWEEIIHRDQREKSFFVDKAKALLHCLAPYQSFGATVAEIVKADPSVIRFLQENVEELKAYLPQPTLEVLLAYKDTSLITDEHWNYTMSVFRLDDSASLHHIQ